MLKRRSKHFALLLVLTMLATMFVGVGTASAAASYTNITAPTVADGGDTSLGRVKVSFNLNDFSVGDEVFFKLPKDFKLFEENCDLTDVEVANNTGAFGAVGDVLLLPGTTVIREIAAVPANNFVTFTTPATSNALYPASGAGNENISVALVSDNEFKVVFEGGNETPLETNAVFQIEFNNVYVPSHDGDIIMTATAPAGSAFSEGSVLVGRSASSGTVTIAATDTQTSDSDFEVTFRITESVPGSLKAEKDSIKFRLPNGYAWAGTSFVRTVDVWGTSALTTMDINSNNDFAGQGTDTLSFVTTDSLAASTAAACFDLTLAFEVDDETLVKAGDINARITGRSTVTPSEIIVGKYGEFDSTVSIKSVKEGVAGTQEIEIDDIIIKESIAGSLVAGRSVTIELPEQARWQINQDAGITAAGAVLKGNPDTVAMNKGVGLNTAAALPTYTGTDDRTARYTVVGGSTAGAAELKLENLEILVQPGYVGEIVAKFGGTAGVTGEVVIANIVAPVKLEASSKPVIQIGAVADVGDIVITENLAEAIAKGTLRLRVPQDVEFAAVPTVEKTEGDLKIGTVTRSDNYRNVDITIESDSTVPSTLKITNIKYKVYRTVPEGNITVSALGDALIDLTGTPAPGGTAKTNPWPNSTSNGSCVNAVIGTAAAGVTAVDASFVIGSTTYMLAGTEQAMDVAPYIKDSRTYMPIRYVAYAMGINDANILWDGDKQTVTLMKGDKVVQLTIGSNLITINGAAVTMDVAPEITSDRTMLPIRFVANAFGADAEWDAATQTVTIK